MQMVYFANARPRVLLGLMWLLGILGGCATAAGGGPLPSFTEYEGAKVREVLFAGDLLVDEGRLGDVARIREPRCKLRALPLFLCFLGTDPYELDLNDLVEDVARIHLFYRDLGYYGTRVVPTAERLEEDWIAVRFGIAPGDRVVLRELKVEGTEGIIDPARLVPALPLEVGGPFRRIAFLETADTIRTILRRRGHVYAEVLRNYSIDTIADVAEARFVAVPGPVVRVDSVVVLGGQRLGVETVRQLLPFDEGDVLAVGALEQGQRNLYGLEFVSFASVQLAEEAVPLDADTASVTVVARVVEAAKYAVLASAGYGTIDCFRGEMRAIDRNFLGGARRLELSGEISKVGVGTPTDLGLGGALCPVAERDEFSDTINYRLAVNYTQPRLFGTEYGIGAQLQVLRRSELDAYLRYSVGGQLSVARMLTDEALASVTLNVERGYTRSSPAFFCLALEVCLPPVRERLETPRWSNYLNASLRWERGLLEGANARGLQARGDVFWSTPLLFSDDRYLNVVGEVAGYRPIAPGWVLAGRLRAGAFLVGDIQLNPFDPTRTTESFIPPEQRFYAGGPNSVRGYPRNSLGPRLYFVLPERTRAIVSSTGGTRIALASVELRGPTTFDRIRWSAFVDAGQVWAPGVEIPIEPDPIAITPGAGIRILTPIGPFRVDVGYNPYSPPEAPLYQLEEDGSLDLLLRRFEKPIPGLLGIEGLQLHFALGRSF